MSELADSSVDLMITSPPYWQLKDYGTEDQIGFNDSYESYINNLHLVWKECIRVLKNGCRLCINIGDQFARSVYYGRYKVIPIRTEIIKFCETMGMDYMGAIIWQKKTTTNTTGGASVMGSYPNPRNGILSIDYEFILLFKKLGTPEKVDPEIKQQSSMTKEEWKEYFAGHWNFGGTRQDGHIAMFPEELPKRLIKMFSFVGDTVLDPFLGSGTTSLAACKLNRNSVGYEINPEFIPTIQKKLVEDNPVSQNANFKFIQGENSPTNFENEIANLPYIFKDPHAFDNKIDVKKKQFGSKLDENSKAQEEYLRVKKIESPEVLDLSDGTKVRLLGIKVKPEQLDSAIEFLEKKFKNQRIFLKYDEVERDSENNLLAYVYLKNKTFINAHLIKHGFADVDLDCEFKLRAKFSKLAANSES